MAIRKLLVLRLGLFISGQHSNLFKLFRYDTLAMGIRIFQHIIIEFELLYSANFMALFSDDSKF